MPEFDKIRLGLLGFGVGKVYAGAFRSLANFYDDLPPVELVAIGTSHPESGELACRRFGFHWSTTDYRQVLESPEINTLVIAVPNYLHAPVLSEALATGKAIYMDKPLAVSLEQAQALLKTSRAADIGAQMIFEIRHCPALQTARQYLQNGRLGDIYTFRAHYYRSSYADPGKPIRWKGQTQLSGTGALGDLASHLIDLVSWLVGQPERVAAQLRTFICQRPEGPGGTPVPVETDDHVIIQAALPGGTMGTIEAGRVFTGPVNDMGVEISGSQGSLRWNLMDGAHLYFCERHMPENERGWLQIPTLSRYPGAFSPSADVPTGLVHYHVASAADFVRHTVTRQPYEPGLAQGARVQAVIEAAEESHRQEAWTTVSRIE